MSALREKLVSAKMSLRLCQDGQISHAYGLGQRVSPLVMRRVS
jgi:hypothetical protein